MQDRDVLAKVAATQVLSGLYQAIADHAQIDAILNAMDDFLDSNPEGLEAGEADWKSMFREHFGRVGQFLDVDPPVEKDSPIVHVDKQVVPALVMNRHHEVIAFNELFLKITDGRSPPYAMPLQPQMTNADWNNWPVQRHRSVDTDFPDFTECDWPGLCCCDQE